MQSVSVYAHCDLDTHECSVDTFECDYDTHKYDYDILVCDLYTHSAVSTRSVILTGTNVIASRSYFNTHKSGFYMQSMT
jgi:hypothetical protein